MRAPNLPVLFHPDCNRRLRNHTESADPADCSASARGLWRSLAITAGGDFHPAPRTRSDGNPTNAINAPFAQQCNIFRQLPHCAKPIERFSTAKDYYGSKLVGFAPVPAATSRRPPAVSTANVTGRECLSVGLTRRFQRTLHLFIAGRCYDA